MSSRILSLVMCGVAAMACTKESHTPKTELSCSWSIMESYPEQVSGDCTIDTSKDSIEIPLAEITPLATTFVIELNGKTLDAGMYQLDAAKKLVTVGPLSSDMKKGTAKIRYTADRQQETKSAEATIVNGTTVGTCSFLLQLSNGSKLEPIELPNDFQTDGLKVSLTYREHPEMTSTCQAGPIVEVLTIQKL